MWNRLVTPSIDDREGMDGGGEGTSDKEENGGREWLSMAAMTVDGGVDRDEPAHLVDQVIHDMEVIGDTSAEGDNRMVQLSRRICRSMDPPRFECQSICLFFMDRDVESPCHTVD